MACARGLFLSSIHIARVLRGPNFLAGVNLPRMETRNLAHASKMDFRNLCQILETNAERDRSGARD
jgi:hypothetical protein